MSVNACAWLVVGVRVSADDFFEAPGAPVWECRQGHVWTTEQLYCGRCGNPLNAARPRAFKNIPGVSEQLYECWTTAHKVDEFGVYDVRPTVASDDRKADDPKALGLLICKSGALDGAGGSLHCVGERLSAVTLAADRVIDHLRGQGLSALAERPVDVFLSLHVF